MKILLNCFHSLIRFCTGKLAHLNKFYFLLISTFTFLSLVYLISNTDVIQMQKIDLSSIVDANNITRSFGEQIIRHLGVLNRPSTGSPAQPPCLACMTAAATTPTLPPLSTDRIRGEQCSAQNNYLEKQIEDLTSKNNFFQQIVAQYESQHHDRTISLRCVQTMLQSKLGASHPSFQNGCRGSSNGQARPCLSTNYVRLITSSLDISMKCLRSYINPSGHLQDEDLRAILGMFYQESGLHINAMSPRGAGGVGQMTSVAIADMNRNEIPNTRQFLRSQGGLCAQLSEVALGQNMSSNNRCERISIAAGNPMKNIVYSLAYFKSSRSQLSQRFFTRSSRTGQTDFTRLFGPAPCNESDSACSNSQAMKSRQELQEDLLSRISIWAHNTGLGGMTVPYEALARRWITQGRALVPGSGKNSVANFLQELSRAMVTNGHSANRGRTRETSNYYPNVQKHLSQIEANVGEGGSCIR